MTRKKDFGESLDRILSQKNDPSKVDGIMNGLLGMIEPPVDNRSIPDRLWVLWTRIKSLRAEAESLSSVLEYHSGSRLSQVVDVLSQAETLTEETISQTTGQTPTEEFRVIDKGGEWEIRDRSKGLGIRVKKWDGINRCYLLLVQDGQDPSETEFDEETFERLVSFGRERFPQEFESMDPIFPECL